MIKLGIDKTKSIGIAFTFSVRIEMIPFGHAERVIKLCMIINTICSVSVQPNTHSNERLTFSILFLKRWVKSGIKKYEINDGIWEKDNSKWLTVYKRDWQYMWLSKDVWVSTWLIWLWMELYNSFLLLNCHYLLTHTYFQLYTHKHDNSLLSNTTLCQTHHSSVWSTLMIYWRQYDGAPELQG